jgi:tetratricopeptide (TPR) repeat protein
MTSAARLLAIVPTVVLASCSFFHDSKEPSAKSAPAPSSGLPRNAAAMTSAQWLAQSLEYYRQSKFIESAFAAQTAANLQPDLPEAWNNVGAAYAALHLWDAAIQADQQALRLKPDFQLARNNLAWATEQKRLGVQ